MCSGLASDVLAALPQVWVIYRVYRSCQSRVRKTQCLYLKVTLKLGPLAELRERTYLLPLAEPLSSVTFEKIQGARQEPLLSQSCQQKNESNICCVEFVSVFLHHSDVKNCIDISVSLFASA